ncbi:MAG: S8 family serine peptidase [Acidimicrobiia bacterium]|nr:S8 family serine peptidase [Acidimicrobiia bacterium]
MSFAEVLDGVDVSIEASATGVKETLVLESAESQREFTYMLDLHGVEPVVDDAGHVWFVEESAGVSAARFVVPRGWMVDSSPGGVRNGAGYSDGVAYEVMTVDGLTVLNVSLDDVWLDDPDRVYPVVVDPALGVVAQVGDTYVTEGDGADHSSSPTLLAGYDPQAEAVSRAYVNHAAGLWEPMEPAELGSSWIEFLADKQVLGGWQVMEISGCASDPGANLNVYRPGAAWLPQGLTWDSQPPLGQQIGTSQVLGAQVLRGLGFDDCTTDPTLTGSFASWWIGGALRQWTSGAWGYTGMVLAAEDESVGPRWELAATQGFDFGGFVVVWWAEPPAPGGPLTPTAVGPSGVVSTGAPTLTATYEHDDASADGFVLFVVETIDGVLRHLAVSGVAEPGQGVSADLPPGALEFDTTYRIRAWSVEQHHSGQGLEPVLMDLFAEQANLSSVSEVLVTPSQGSSSVTPAAVSGCEPRIVVAAHAADGGGELLAYAAEGDEIHYEVGVVNEPIGPCVVDGVGAHVAAAVELTTTHVVGEVVETASAWLETEVDGVIQVLPTSAGLTTDGAQAPGGCPGGQVQGCDPGDLAAIVGATDLLPGEGIAVEPDQPGNLEVRFQPTLDEGEIDLLTTAGSVQLAIAVKTTHDGLMIARTPVTFGAATPAEDVVVHYSVAGDPGGSTPLTEDLAAFEPVELVGAFTYQTSPADDHTVDASFSATGAPPAVDADPHEVRTAVGPPAHFFTDLYPVVRPAAVVTGSPQEVLIEVAVRGDLTGSVVLDGPTGHSTLVDDGTNGDRVAGDGIYSATISWTPTVENVESLSVTATVDGQPTSGEVALPVYPASAPVTPTEVNIGPVLTAPEGHQVLADFVTAYGAEGAPYGDIDAAVTAVGGEIVGLDFHDAWSVQLPPAATFEALETLAAQLQQSTSIAYVELEALYEPTAVSTSDPRISEQWHLDRVSLPEAWMWSNGKASDPVRIGILDNGINHDHEDLDVAEHWRTTGETAPQLNCAGDREAHGTAVAGVAAATTDNGVGIAGAAWHAELHSIRVSDDDCGYSSREIAAGVMVAVDEARVDVINISIAGNSGTGRLLRALEHASRQGVVVVVAAGNDGTDGRAYPAGFGRSETIGDRTHHTNVISVGGTDEHDERAEWISSEGVPKASNFGAANDPWVDIAAPAIPILTTNGVGDRDDYTVSGGTSMASPLVAGVAALMLQDPADRRNSTTAWLVRHRLLATGEEIDTDEDIGPLVDAEAAVSGGTFGDCIHALTAWESTGFARTTWRQGTTRSPTGTCMIGLRSTTSSSATITRQFDLPAGQSASAAPELVVRYQMWIEQPGGFAPFICCPMHQALVAIDSFGYSNSYGLGGTFYDDPSLEFPFTGNSVSRTRWRTERIPLDLYGDHFEVTIEIGPVLDPQFGGYLLIDEVRLEVAP